MNQYVNSEKGIAAQTYGIHPTPENPDCFDPGTAPVRKFVIRDHGSVEAALRFWPRVVRIYHGIHGCRVYVMDLATKHVIRDTHKLDYPTIVERIVDGYVSDIDELLRNNHYEILADIVRREIVSPISPRKVLVERYSAYFTEEELEAFGL